MQKTQEVCAKIVKINGANPELVSLERIKDLFDEQDQVQNNTANEIDDDEINKDE